MGEGNFIGSLGLRRLRWAFLGACDGVPEMYVLEADLSYLQVRSNQAWHALVKYI